MLAKSPGTLTAGFPEAINRAFSKQSAHYDETDNANAILTDLRKQVYRHVAGFMRPCSQILELNAGTGIDALYFARRGHAVLATDLSDGMIAQIERKIAANDLGQRLTCRQLSYEELHLLAGKKFDYVFSNFGGLNCIDDLSRVSRHLPPLLNPGAYLTWVVMPPVCPWELAGVLKGHGAKAFRRLQRSGAVSHLEGEYFKTYYHSLRAIRSALGRSFGLLKSEGLAALSPPPHRGSFPQVNRRLYSFLRWLDNRVGHAFPFNRCADHIVVTFRYGGGR